MGGMDCTHQGFEITDSIIEEVTNVSGSASEEFKGIAVSGLGDDDDTDARMLGA
jgi:hypothetical protein